MRTIREYHRPGTLDEALILLARPDVDSAPLAGGTVLNGLPDDVPDEVVDLQSLGLNNISRDGTTLDIGATVTLRQLEAHEWVPPVLRDLAHREAPNTIRNAATVGGTVAAANPESGLLAGFVAYDATVTIADTEGTAQVTLSDLLIDPSSLEGSLITSVLLTLGGDGATEATARTPADTPIVRVVGHRTESGNLRLAATGVAEKPVTVDADRITDLDPPPDFRGSAEYRRHLAKVLVSRVVTRLGEGGPV